jgi:hypothetical protein
MKAFAFTDRNDLSLEALENEWNELDMGYDRKS